MSYEPRLEHLVQRIHRFNADRNWAQFHTPKDLAIGLSLEASELLEHFQWLNTAEMQHHLDQHREAVGEELADIFYYVLLMCQDFDIDLIAASEAKMAKNEAKYPVEKAKNNHAKYTELS